MKIRDSFIEGNDKRAIPHKSGITASQGYSSHLFAIFLLLSAIALYGFTLSLANAAKPVPPPIECSITLNPASATPGAPVTLTADVNRSGRKEYVWTFVGVAPSTSTVNPVSVTYTDGGTYAVDVEISVKGEVVNCPSSVEVTGAGAPNPVPAASANGPYTGTTEAAVSFSSAGTTAGVSYSWDFGDGGTSSNADPSHTYVGNGEYDVELTVTDSNGETSTDTTFARIVEIPAVSVNSTSQNGTPGVLPVSEQLLDGMAGYNLFAVNDLGMHCGDLDTRISSILPPFNVLHATVIQRGSEPSVLTPADGVSVVYSAASNPHDPILGGMNSAGSGPVATSILLDGSVYKTNFWDSVLQGAYDPFYPHLNPFNGAQLTPLSDPPFSVTADVGLPMPDVELLHLHTPSALEASQQFMPGILAPFVANNPQTFTQFVTDQPFFIDPSFEFGYVSEGVDWYEAPGIPLTAYDDFGRENPWPLYRVQAHNIDGEILASTDTVVPISGEANCGICHNATVDGGNGEATRNLIDGTVATVLDDPQLDEVPRDVSLEYAADLNLVRLHDQKHGTSLESNTPVVCQTCHYTPALDLAQLGPLGPENDPGNTLHNGRDQLKHKSMSNVMHSHHGSVTDADGVKLFPDMPAAEKNENGVVTNAVARREALEATCYQCHPGRRTDCLRGAMANGGMLCQDCHGDMEQVGNDFSRTVGSDSIGSFELAGDFYDDPESATPRVPWANEPGCGSCHTGDALNNLADPDDDDVEINYVDANMNGDGIRLFQAYRTGVAYTKATPIVPTNKRFAENVIENTNPAVSDPDDPRIGNPMLYRVSTGHGGVFCEACHGATHGIWPNKNPNANDNVTAMQLQGHTGTITECTTCHSGSFNIDDFKNKVAETGEMDGPHGMHPVNDPMWKKHKEVFELNKDSCRTCHGVDGEGTVLSTTAATRTMECKNTDGNFPECAAGEKFATVDRNTPIACDNCHAMEN